LPREKSEKTLANPRVRGRELLTGVLEARRMDGSVLTEEGAMGPSRRGEKKRGQRHLRISLARNAAKLGLAI